MTHVIGFTDFIYFPWSDLCHYPSSHLPFILILPRIFLYKEAGCINSTVDVFVLLYISKLYEDILLWFEDQYFLFSKLFTKRDSLYTINFRFF